MNRLVTAFLIGFAAIGTANAAEDEAVALAQAFCGLAELDQGMGRMYLLSSGLTEKVTAALVAGGQGETAFGAGVPWASGDAAANICTAGAVASEGGVTLVDVIYGQGDAGWTDQLVLVAGEGGALVVDDIRYGKPGEAATLGEAASALLTD
ncbi:MAG: hypothetical protein RH978_18175 [Roseitalea porphyridii]|uniref:hypothetical protein n=1 Tax=Roseitalea porphyridii TaxID=1852022 RepID=UPI0032EEA8C8